MEILNTAPTLDEKADRLRQILAGSVASSSPTPAAWTPLFCLAAHQALGAQMCAVIADSASLARNHLEDALAFARERGIPSKCGNAGMENPPTSATMPCAVSIAKMNCSPSSNVTASPRIRRHRLRSQRRRRGRFSPRSAGRAPTSRSRPLLEARLTKAEIRHLQGRRICGCG